MIHAPDLTPTVASIDTLARLDRVVRHFVEGLRNLGALVAIDVDGVGRVSITAGHSDLERTRAVTPSDLYQVGSQTKTLNALTTFLLARDGLIDLDAPVRGTLDLPIDARITARDLLMNRSGLGESTSGQLTRQLDPRIPTTPRDLLALALPQGQIFPPGERFDYCNTGWIVTGMLIEKASGMSFGDAVAKRVLEPLGLTSSGFGGNFPRGEPMRCYLTMPIAPEPIEMTRHVSWIWGGGDGVSSAGDMLAIFQSLVRPDSPLGVSLHDLTAVTAKPSAKPHFAMSLGGEYGLGIERRAWAGADVWGHPGSTGSTRSSTWIDAERRVAVATCVTGNVDMFDTDEDVRYPREQLFAMALNAAYALRGTS